MTTNKNKQQYVYVIMYDPMAPGHARTVLEVVQTKRQMLSAIKEWEKVFPNDLIYAVEKPFTPK